LFTALALCAAMAHLLELPKKIKLSSEEYIVVQKIYYGWALLGVVVAGAIVSTLIVAIQLDPDQDAFPLTVTGLICLVGTQIVFWLFTYLVNKQTKNWTLLPHNWIRLRKQWEYSHAANAGLNLVALSALILSLLVRL